ncbi:hypothetical protein AC626_22875 [Pseudoalteromonas rubra]|uniref:Response regulatory domain-containing protein n=1 Tax=Pseudoalteromonas rubra TaxID=43658 RepID=A0A0L0ENK7_9GAMM|nr:hypothetical protein AC626_22875 [Pseudoalteromonas rubra]
MDMQMPVMDGLQATRAISKLTNTIQPPILAMTANAMQDDIQTCLDAGMVGHIAKPIDVENMVATILAHTQNKRQVMLVHYKSRNSVRTLWSKTLKRKHIHLKE